MQPISVLVLLFACQALAGRVVMEPGVEPWHPETSSWMKGGPAKDMQLMKLHVPLKIEQSSLSELERIFWEVSDPEHANYGAHVSVDDITNILNVPSERVNKVSHYFQEHGARVTVVQNRDVMIVEMSVSTVNEVFETTIFEFFHKKRPDITILRAGSHYSLPEEIAAEVMMVGELKQFPRLTAEAPLLNATGSGTWPNQCDNSACSGLVQPSVLSKAYSLDASSRNEAAKANTMAVAEFQGQYFKPSDLATFSSSCKADVQVSQIIGGNQPSAGVESELDIEYIRVVAPKIPLTVVYSDQFSLLNWVTQITNNQSIALVHSVSYGNDEAQQTSVEYMQTCSTGFMKAGARGLSILFASGDQGVCGREGCGFGILHKKSFKPDFPAGSPYITAVGGTNFVGAGIGPEEAWSASGGGFSNTFGIPSYQATAVAAYKASPDAKLPPSYLYNNTGRGYPDVAALGGTKTPYCIVSNGNFGGVAGTSAACPVVAGVFARLNGIRLAAGNAPMGFLNPFIYKNPSAFNDVKSGNNNAGTSYGFEAIAGWDPATGFGTPNFAALAKLV